MKQMFSVLAFLELNQHSFIPVEDILSRDISEPVKHLIKCHVMYSNLNSMARGVRYTRFIVLIVVIYQKNYVKI